MATIQAISVTGIAIRNLLHEACPRDVFGGAEFKLAQAANLATLSFTGLGVSIYLYRVAFNGTRRCQSPRKRVNGLQFKPPVSLDLHFLITAWARTPEQQWALLAWAVRTLEDTPSLSSGFLNQNAGSDGSGPHTVFGAEEDIDLVGESLSLQDMVSVWEVAKQNQQPSVAYVARAVLIDSLIELHDGRPVQTRAFDMAVLTQ